MDPDKNVREILKHYPEITGIHPACSALPTLSAVDFGSLSESIENRGLANPIIVDESGMLVDGRHRLLLCHKHAKEPRFKTVHGDPWEHVNDQNVAKRQLTTEQKARFAHAWRQSAEAEAKERQRQNALNNQPQSQKVEQIPHSEIGKSRDIIGAKVGVSGKTMDAYRNVAEHAPDLLSVVESGEMSLTKAGKEAGKRKKSKKVHPAENHSQNGKEKRETVQVLTVDGKATEIPKPAKVVFNKTNDSVDWASWTWNPVTGCQHGCKFCYAREIAHSERMADYYPNKFKPSLHAYRLAAPSNSKVPQGGKARDGRVFVCSMADLFGKWVPDHWIEMVFNACLQAPDWEYLFLTKWPARYAQMPLLEKAWYGASVIKQADVKRVESAMQKFETDCIRWISLEPMLEPIQFNDLSWCNLVVIGSQTSTNQPDGWVEAFAPDFDWVVDVVNQCREFGVPYYLKANLGMEKPGMNLPKMEPAL